MNGGDEKPQGEDVSLPQAEGMSLPQAEGMSPYAVPRFDAPPEPVDRPGPAAYPGPAGHPGFEWEPVPERYPAIPGSVPAVTPYPPGAQSSFGVQYPFDVQRPPVTGSSALGALIAGTVTFLVCCNVLGFVPATIAIVSMVRAKDVPRLWASGDYQGAHRAAATAQRLASAAWLTFGVSLVLVVVVVMLAVTVA